MTAQDRHVHQGTRAHGNPVAGAGHFVPLVCWFGLVLLLAGLCRTACAQAQQPSNSPVSETAPVLTDIRSILNLPGTNAQLNLPVDVTGVVTYFDPKWDTLFIQDHTGGIYVFPGQEDRPRLQPGQNLRIHGMTLNTQPSISIRQRRLTTLGLAPLPPPIPISGTQLLGRLFDSQWVEFEAVVREWVFRYGRWEMELDVEGSRVFADSPRVPGKEPAPNLVHSRVRVQGVASSVPSPGGQPTAIRVFVPSPDSYTILQPPPADPFTLPSVQVIEITGPAANYPTGVRLRVQGIVIHSSPDQIVLQDGDSGIVVNLQVPRSLNDPDGRLNARQNSNDLVPGNFAEAVGYVSRLSSPPSLVDAYARKATATPRAEIIPKVVLPSELVEYPPLHTLVELDAEFREELRPVENVGNDNLVRWILNQDSQIIEAVIPDGRSSTAAIQAGSLLRLRGFIEPKPSPTGARYGYRLHLRSGDDVVVLRNTSRWEARDLLRVLLISATVIILLLGWALLLWREGGTQRALNRDLEARIRARTAELTLANRNLEEKVADQRRVEFKLVESETRTRAILEHSPEGIVVLEPTQGHFVEVNGAASRLFAASGSELLGRSPFDLSPLRQPDGTNSRESAQQHIRRTLTGGSHRFEWLFCDLEGRDFPCEINLALLPREGRNFIIGTITDITARKRAELIMTAIYEISEAANNAEDLPGLYSRIHAVIRRLMNAENLYIASYDAVRNELSFPYYVDEKDPTPPSRPLGRGLTEFVLRTGRPLLADATVIGDLARLGECFPVGSPAALWLGAPLSLRGRTFGVIAIHEYHNPNAFGSEEKDVLGFVAEQIAIAVDRRRAIDELRASEARLRESEERFSKAFHNCQGALAIVSLENGRYLDVNEGFVRTYGYSREDSLGKTSLDLGLWQDTTHRARLFERLRESGSFRNEETVMRRSDGQILTTVESADVIEIGGRPCVIVFALDITDRKRAETELFHALRKERELNQLKSSFVSLVSHEFRTPLEIILSSGEILQRYHDRLGTEQRTRQLRAITSSVRRMAQMMNEVLLLGRFDAGRMEFQPAPIDLPAFSQRIADDIGAATNHRCPIELELQGDLSGAAGDEALLGHIFTNLLSNAVKYSPGTRPVRFRLAREVNETVFTVQDEGLGIPEADRARLFSAFHRGSNVGQVPGSGLGLVIVRRCTELHGGNLCFDSKEGVGTTFQVRIPLWSDSEDNHPSVSTSS